jgi:hypothetical protein
MFETLPSSIGTSTSVFTDSFKIILRYIRYRWFDKLNIIHTRLAPGYHSPDERLFHATFELLVDYVEIEQANMLVAFGPEDVNLPWWYSRYFRVKTGRFPKYGLIHLKQEGMQSLTDERALAAQEIWDLYHWWKFIRPSRIDPSEASGMDIWFKTNSHKDVLPVELITLTADIEAAYEKEDDMQLMRIVAIRRHLWT